MEGPKRPANELERLAALHSYEVLDTPPEPAFDGLARLAAEIIGVPVALICFVDAERQWFKSCRGIAVRETSRDVSICDHVVASEAPLVVPDTLADPRFAASPLVLGDPAIRFYAGAPLRTRDGLVLGTVCAMDRVPREVSPERLELLGSIAAQVVEQLECRRERLVLEGERRQLRALLGSMAEGVVLFARDGTIRECNVAAEGILGLTREQMQGLTCLDPRWRAIHEDGSPFPGDTHPAVTTLQTGVPQRDVVMGVHKPDGTLTWILINAMPLLRDGSVDPYGVVVTFHDITARRAAESAAEHMARHERLVTTGTLAAGVGHEVNNPLAYVVINLEHALGKLLTRSPETLPDQVTELVQVLTDAREGAERIRKIVQALHSFARPESDPVPTCVRRIIDHGINLTMHETRQTAAIVAELSTTPPVLADEARITQVLVNLLVNAAQAFTAKDPRRNRITVGSAAEPPGYVSITVADNGPGIPAHVRARVFDPFFTTKPVGKGTGLGLYIASGIVTAHGGELTVESVEGEGTTFRITLPATAPDPTGEHAATTRARVLVVDDEALILRAMDRSLRDDYDVVAISDPSVAWLRLEQGERFDVVVCDLMMAPLSGEDLYRRCERHDPDLASRFVFITGGATTPTAQSFFAGIPNEWLEKPFSRSRLIALVESVIERHRAARAR